MIVEQLIASLDFRSTGIDKAKAAAKTIADLRRNLSALAEGSRKGFNAGGIDRLAGQFRAAALAARKAQSDMASGAGLGRADAAARKHVSTVQSLGIAYRDAARQARALGSVQAPASRGSGSWIGSELKHLRDYQRLQRQVAVEERRGGGGGVSRMRRGSGAVSGDHSGDAWRGGQPFKYGVGRTLVGVGAGVSAGHATRRAGRTAIEEGAGTVREDIRAKNAGITPEESGQLRQKATALSLDYPSLSNLSIREQGRLLIPNVGDVSTALNLLPEYIKGMVAVQGINGPEGAKEEMETFAKFVDVIGQSRKVEETKKLIDGYVRARQLDSTAVKASDFLNSSKTGGAAGKGLTTDYWARVFPTLAMQQGGARTGKDYASAYANTVLGRTPEQPFFNQVDAGLRVGAKTGTTKTGKRKKVETGQLVDADLFGSDPYEWAKKHLVPMMVKKGAMPKSYLTGDF